jgi:citrate synthase
VLHGGVTALVEDALRNRRPLPGGFGHSVYRDRDPRADALLPLVRQAAAPATWRLVEEALEVDDPPNIDLAGAALALAGEMVPGAGEAVFAVARVAGWLAHAAEEYRRPFRFRPRAGYRGEPPVSDAPRRGSA